MMDLVWLAVLGVLGLVGIAAANNVVGLVVRAYALDLVAGTFRRWTWLWTLSYPGHRRNELRDEICGPGGWLDGFVQRHMIDKRLSPAETAVRLLVFMAFRIPGESVGGIQQLILRVGQLCIGFVGRLPGRTGLQGDSTGQPQTPTRIERTIPLTAQLSAAGTLQVVGTLEMVYKPGVDALNARDDDLAVIQRGTLLAMEESNRIAQRQRST